MDKLRRGPVRPALPLSFWLFGVVWLSVFGSLECSLNQLQGATSGLMKHPAFWLSLVLGYAVGIIIVSRLARQKMFIVTCLICGMALSGGLFGLQCGRSIAAKHELATELWKQHQGDVVAVTAIKDPVQSLYGWVGEVLIESKQGSLKATASYGDGVHPLKLGQCATVPAYISPVPLTVESGRLLKAGLVARLKVSSELEAYWPRGLKSALLKWREKQLAGLSKYNPSHYSPSAYYESPATASSAQNGNQLAVALLRGLLLGDRSAAASKELSNLFAKCGLSHIMSVSGTHLALVAGLVMVVCQRLLGLRLAYVVACVITLGYVLVTGMSAATWRSWGMLAVFTCGVVLFRRPHALHSLSVTGIACLLISPLLVYNVGFQMSVIAVAGIVIFAPWLQGWISLLGPAIPRWLSSAAAVTTVATLATLPISASVFGTISQVGIAANLVFVPLLSVLLTAGVVALLVVTILPPVAGFMWVLLIWVSKYLLFGVDYLASYPRAVREVAATPVLWVSMVVLAGVVYTTWPLWGKSLAAQMRITRWVRLSLVLLIGPLAMAHVVSREMNASPAPSDCRISFLDVGQGDATLVETPDTTFLIDAGPNEQALIKALDELHIRAIDVVLFTHDHADHTGGAPALKAYKPHLMLTATPTNTSPGFAAIADELRITPQILHAGTRVSDDFVDIDVLWPKSVPSDADENSQSLIMIVQWGGDTSDLSSLLISGDAEADAIHAALEGTGTNEIDLLKVAHHGSADAVDESLVRDYEIRESIISCGADNPYGHPARTTLSLLNAYTDNVWRTDLSGSYVVGR